MTKFTTNKKNLKKKYVTLLFALFPRFGSFISLNQVTSPKGCGRKNVLSEISQTEKDK